MTNDTQTLLGFVSVALTCAGSLPYIRDVLRGRLKPHAFTWLIWTLTAGITAAAQVADHGGPGAWPMVVGATLNVFIFLSALKYGEKNITRADWVMLLASLAAIPLWMATDDPLWSVILVTAIDTIGYIPTFRKSWNKPREEGTAIYLIASAWQCLSVVAMTHKSMTTLLAPIVYVVMNMSLVIYLYIRRWRPT